MSVDSIPTPATVLPRAGQLASPQMDLVIRHLPVQVSLADESDVLVYWNGEIFADCEEQFIGRHVNDCHAPQSRRTIDRMLEEFRAGRREHATFWKWDEGRLNLYVYRALRDDDGAYRGILETVQDITEIVGLEGEKKTLDW